MPLTLAHDICILSALRAKCVFTINKLFWEFRKRSILLQKTSGRSTTQWTSRSQQALFIGVLIPAGIMCYQLYLQKHTHPFGWWSHNRCAIFTQIKSGTKSKVFIFILIDLSATWCFIYRMSFLKKTTMTHCHFRKIFLLFFTKKFRKL